MSKVLDLTGQKFGRLTIIRRVENDKEGKACWLCKCDCGNEKIVSGKRLRNGNVKSCGCFRKEKTIQRLTTHGLHNTKLYSIWSYIKKRCYNNQSSNYYLYGGRGIIVCEEWKNNFMAFYNWAINNGYQDDLTIDRIDVNGNYEPNNCRWATVREQANNRRNNHFITFNNETHTLSEWSRILNIRLSTLLNRLKSGWADEQALETAVKKKKLV